MRGDTDLIQRPADSDLLRAQLESIVAGGNTKRFHTVNTVHVNTVAHHSYGVALLCWLLTNGEPSVQLLMAALTHDIGEQWTGDMPAPAKRAMGIREAFGEVEARALQMMGLEFPTDARDTEILKLADAMDGMLYCITERRLGNINIEEAYSNFHSYADNSVRGDDEIEVLSTIETMWRRCNERSK